MSKTASNISALIIAAFAIFLMFLVATNMMRPAPLVKSTVASTLESAPANLNIMTLYGFDVYGDNWSGGSLIACPGVTQDQLTKAGADVEGVQFVDGAIPEDVNYLITAGVDQTFNVEKLSRGKVDLCSSLMTQAQAAGQPAMTILQPNQPLTLQRGDNGVWTPAA